MNELNQVLPDLKLRFNINHPDLDECYNEGYYSAVEEIEEGDNPYKLGTLEHEHWQEGWWAGWYREEPLASDLTDEAANEGFYHFAQDYFVKFLKLSGALAATALIGYQLIELVA